MKYLRNFETMAAYSAATIYRPSVSLIEGTGDIIYDPLFFFNPRYLYSDLSTSKNLDSSKTVIGVEVIPGSHMADGKARFVSVKNMSKAEGEVENGSAAVYDGSTEIGSINITWGDSGDISGMTNYEDIGYPLKRNNSAITSGNPHGYVNELSSSADGCFLITDFDSGVTDNRYPFFNQTFMPTIEIEELDAVLPYPFNSDGSRNLFYSGTSQAGMVISDMDGKGNTDILMARKTVTWNIGDALDTEVSDSSKINHPAAIACRRFNPASSNTSGQWYLPSAGELGYLFANISKINAKIDTLPSGQGVKIGVLNSLDEPIDSLGGWLWSSSVYSSSDAWRLYTDGGYMASYYRSDSGGDNRVRAFFALQ